MTKLNGIKQRSIATILLIILISSASGCQFSLFEFPNISLPGGNNNSPTSLPGQPDDTTSQDMPTAQVTFTAVLPESIGEGETLFVAILDEVTGLALNSTNYEMKPRDPQTYSASVLLPIGSVVKYRYFRRSNVQLLEDSASDLSIRYRLYMVNGPGENRDIIASWIDRAYTGGTGGIEGQLYDVNGGTPLPNILVTAGGVQTITDSAGRFSLQGLPVGTHNLVTYALDGTYKTFQQGAAVADGRQTPVVIYLDAAPTVTVTFNVKVPDNTVPGAPVRIAGNLFQLGNTFADLRGGISAVADRMPVLTALPDGRYTISLELPIGADIRYKYTLGDGFWNAEHNSKGYFVVRQIIVPDYATIINDAVGTWGAGNSGPILFEASVPSNTPVGDIIYIQFNPYGWTEPIPMWPIGNNHWVYKLYSPLNILSSFGYRFCRAGQCGSADDIETMGDSSKGRFVTSSVAPQNIVDTITGWAWLDETSPGSLVGAPVTVRQNDFIAGVELQPTQHPNWVTSIPQAMQNIQALGANWVILTPTWTFVKTDPLILAPIPGKDSFWNDTYRMTNQARGLNMTTALFPTPRFSTNPNAFWNSASRNASWWEAWFNYYQAFLVNYADLAAQSGSQALVLGGEWVAPALPGGTLSDQTTPSGVPANAMDRWKNIIAELRNHFRGKIFWALPYTQEAVEAPLEILESVDGIYLLWDIKLSGSSIPTKQEMSSEVGRLLDNGIAPLSSIIGKPIIISVSYPSVDKAASGCVPNGQGGCLRWQELNPSTEDIKSLNRDVQLQSDIYEAILTAINERAWVAGFVSRGYYPPTILQDKSASVRGKPAADVLWYWFPRLLGLQ